MTTWLVLMATATLGVDQGWQPIAGGGYEYILQIEPETLDSIKSGRDLFFHLPESLGGVQSYRITSGSDPLPHDGEPLPAIAQTAKTDAPGAMTPEPGSRPLPAQPVGDRQGIGNQKPTGNQQVSGASAAPIAERADVSKSGPAAATNESPQDGGSPSDDLPKGFDAAGNVETKPIWMSLNAALMVLFASLGVNLFLGWVTVAQRGRYRSVLARLAVR